MDRMFVEQYLGAEAAQSPTCLPVHCWGAMLGWGSKFDPLAVSQTQANPLPPLPFATLGEMPLVSAGRKSLGLRDRPAGLHRYLSLCRCQGQTGLHSRPRGGGEGGPQVHQGSPPQPKHGHCLQEPPRTVTVPIQRAFYIQGQALAEGPRGSRAGSVAAPP